MLAIETLNAAVKKDRVSLRIALAMLAEGQMLNAEEKDEACETIAMLDRFEKRVRQLFGAKRNERTAKLHLAATTLTEEVAVFRESAFWLLDAQGVLDVERAISDLLGIYQHVRRLLRLLIAADSAVSLPEDPVRIDPIPANRYLALTHPEICR